MRPPTRNILPGIDLFPLRLEGWLSDLRSKRLIRPTKVRKALRTPSKKRKPKVVIRSKAEMERLQTMSPEMIKMLGL